jgi:hypothetical protein
MRRCCSLVHFPTSITIFLQASKTKLRLYIIPKVQRQQQNTIIETQGASPGSTEHCNQITKQRETCQNSEKPVLLDQQSYSSLRRHLIYSSTILQKTN